MCTGFVLVAPGTLQVHVLVLVLCILHPLRSRSCARSRHGTEYVQKVSHAV